MKDKIFFLIFACCILIALSERECQKNQHGSLRPDSNDCSKYYRCEYRIEINKTHEFFWKNEECPPYEYFDWKISNCIPNYGSCKDALLTPYARCLNNEVELDPGNAKQYFECNDGTWTLKYCPSKLYFNETAKQCTKLCKTNSRKYDVNDCSSYFVCKNDEEWISMSCEPEKYFDKTTNLCLNDEKNICQYTKRTTSYPIYTTKKSFIVEKCIETTTKPDLHDCGRYFTCQNGTWTIKMCSENQYFDIFFLECRTDYDGHCQKQHQNKNHVTAGPSICPNGKIVPNNDNCLVYYVCNNGTYVPKICENNTFFNKVMLKCVPEDGSCRKTVKPIIKATTSATILRICDENESKPDANNCERYFECNNNKWVSKQCSSNSYYNSSAKNCVFGSCEKNENKKPIKVGVIGCTEGQTKPDLFDCVRYYICKDAKWVPSQCNRNMYYNKMKNECIQNDGTCKDEPIIINREINYENCQDGETKPDTLDCTRYYLCRKNSWVTAECSKKMYYSNTKKHCILNDGSCKLKEDKNKVISLNKNENCVEGETKRDIFDCTRYYLCKNDIWSASVCEKNQYYNQEKKQCIIDNGTCNKNLKNNKEDTNTPKLVSSCKQGDFKEDSISCNRYYYCRDQVWKLLQCPERYYFNIAQKYCLPNINTCKPTVFESKDPECTEGKFKLDRKITTGYFECINTKWIAKNCEDGFVFNLISKNCIKHASRTEDKTVDTKKNECIDGEHKPNNGSKLTYYACIEGVWKLKSCLNGMIYDPDSTVCLPDMNAKKAAIKA